VFIIKIKLIILIKNKHLILLTLKEMFDNLYQVVSRRLKSVIVNLMQEKKYYKTQEALKRIGISRATFFRWLKDGVVQDVAYKDRRGWRLFTEEDIDRLQKEANKITHNPYQETLTFNNHD
jgi:hypothetical protein